MMFFRRAGISTLWILIECPQNLLEVGQKLGAAVIAKHQKEEGRYPENVAFFWMCNDIMWADGEDMSQMLFLLGTEPYGSPTVG